MKDDKITEDQEVQDIPVVEFNEYRWREQSYIYKCELSGNLIRVPFYSTCSVYAVVHCTADHYHKEDFVESCKSCDLYKTRRGVRPMELPPDDYIDQAESKKSKNVKR